MILVVRPNVLAHVVETVRILPLVAMIVPKPQLERLLMLHISSLMIQRRMRLAQILLIKSRVYIPILNPIIDSMYKKITNQRLENEVI